MWCIQVYYNINFGYVWMLSSIGFSFAWTSLCRRDGLFLYYAVNSLI